MNIAGSTALVTGANRGLGRYFVNELLDRGAAKVYATARNPDSIQTHGVQALHLDITDPSSITRVADKATDVDLLINNAGVTTFQNLVTGNLQDIHSEMDTHFFGSLDMIRAFAPILAANGGGAILNVLSALSFFSYPDSSGYAAAKAAEWSLTNSVRLELAGQHTLVTALHMGSTDTDMMADFDIPKNDPSEVVRAALDGIEHDSLEVLFGPDARAAKAMASADLHTTYPSTVPSTWAPLV